MRLPFPASAVVLAFLTSFASAVDAPKKLLLIGSAPDTHPPRTHEYMAGMELLAKLLKPVAGIEATSVKADRTWKDGPELLGRADGAVLFLTEGAAWLSADPRRLDAFQKLAARGGGLSVLHWGMGSREAKPVEAFADLFGGCHGGPDRKYKVLETTVAPADVRHPITAGVGEVTVRDEFYYRFKLPKAAKPVPILHAQIDGVPEVVAWAWERPDGGRSFGFSGLHFHENWRRRSTAGWWRRACCGR